jgi:hypothetical protein
MSSTRTLQNVINWAQLYCKQIPLTGQGGVANEPALSIANTVLCFILGPPFAWRWNRNNLSFSAVSGTQNYQEVTADLGWIEKATANDGNTTWELEPRLLLPNAVDSGRPTHIAANLDDDNNNITYSLYPVPNAAYTINVVYQKKPVMFTATTATWAPIPDEYQHLYNSGFLAWAYENIDDPRFVTEYEKFIKSVIASSEGMNDSQKLLFLTEKLLALRQQENAQMEPGPFFEGT